MLRTKEGFYELLKREIDYEDDFGQKRRLVNVMKDYLTKVFEQAESIDTLGQLDSLSESLITGGDEGFEKIYGADKRILNYDYQSMVSIDLDFVCTRMGKICRYNKSKNQDSVQRFKILPLIQIGNILTEEERREHLNNLHYLKEYGIFYFVPGLASTEAKSFYANIPAAVHMNQEMILTESGKFILRGEVIVDQQLPPHLEVLLTQNKDIAVVPY